jgi:hypothetical protein
VSPVWVSNSRIYFARDPKVDRLPDVEVWQVDCQKAEPQPVFRFWDAIVGSSGVLTDVSPDGEQLAAIAQRRILWPTANVHILDTKGQLIETLWQDAPDDCKDARALWSANGACIAWHHNFTHGGLSEKYYYGVGLSRLGRDGQWTSQLQPEPEACVTPLAWSPAGQELLCARMSRDERQATLFLMDARFRTTRELFELEVHSWNPGQRDIGRLGDWAIVPDDVALPENE